MLLPFLLQKRHIRSCDALGPNIGPIVCFMINISFFQKFYSFQSCYSFIPAKLFIHSSHLIHLFQSFYSFIAVLFSKQSNRQKNVPYVRKCERFQSEMSDIFVIIQLLMQLYLSQLIRCSLKCIKMYKMYPLQFQLPSPLPRIRIHQV